MRHSEFWKLMDAVFGEVYAPTLARDHALTALDSRTCVQALDDGVPPRDVWHALCDEMEVPLDRRDGGDRRRMVPPRR
ncbi:DUF3046 domain-containing protein [Demequina zhanjiangensis]|uniref:DUF3046 domain-containing protein n=1 Tax=Demequina zhanjiangensis TaxID=3051659 RepID=A0ABT8G3B7_9MICO|nr:DUF3046 domain-containing protein [Demequina sp. SYSU T00b26]MDN4473639.1 DUF3046 domain-containing protein [Demequina sp. SYSU T00b26]